MAVLYGLHFRLQTTKSSFLLCHVMINNMSCHGSISSGSDVKTMYGSSKKYATFQVIFTCVT